MSMEFIWGIVRHALNALATWMVTQGYLQDSQSQSFVGAILLLATVVWSVVNKVRKEKAIDTALNLPEYSTREQLQAALKTK